MAKIKMPTHIDSMMATRMLCERYTLQIASIDGVRLYVVVEGGIAKFEVTNGLKTQHLNNLGYAIREFNAMLGYEEENSDA